MKKFVIIMPGCLGQAGEESIFDQSLPGLTSLASLGEIRKLTQSPLVECEEALWLGMREDQATMRPGPLLVSAFRADPPPRSTQFCLNLLSFNDGMANQFDGASPAEIAEVVDVAGRLNTRDLTLVPGEGFQHALVHEKYLHLHTCPADEVIGKEVLPNLPQGDAEPSLRRYIDDSVNLLSGLELNQRRVDHGIPPLNLLWPWGQGQRLPLPNLALQRGAPAEVYGSSLRLAGLARLVGYQSMDRRAFQSRLQTNFDLPLLAREPSITAIEDIGARRTAGNYEEARWMVRELDRRLLSPLADRLRTEPVRVTIIGTNRDGGLTLTAESGPTNEGIYPFDERSLDERNLAKTSITDAVLAGLKS
jgi:2,3-bisphosphoglycerate-independent phosphoglycerate mutase